MQTKGLDLILAGLLLLGMASGCRERNPAYIQRAQDAPVARDAGSDPPGANDAPPDIVLLPEVAVETPPRLDARPDEPPLDARLDLVLADARDTRLDGRDTPRADDGPNEGPVGDRPRDTADAADVPLPGDARDVPVVLADGPLDSSPTEAAPIDGAPLCPEQTVRGCWTAGNPLIGACHAGQQECTAGAWGPCMGEVLPGAELCGNGVDDDCNGMTDEGCVADCVVVAPAGDDLTADGTVAHPFATLVAGLTFAAAVDGGGPRRVCVAAGTTCAAATTYALDTALAIPDGARLQGNYALDQTGLMYCGDAQPPITGLRFTTAAGAVVFGADVTAPTELGGFVIERFSSSVSPAGGAITAISVAGGKNVVLSGIFITDAPSGETTYGVDVESGGQVTITRSSIAGGQGASSAVGIFVGGGSVVLRDNCDGAANGLCPTACTGNEVLGIRGRTVAGPGTATGSSAVYLTGSASASTIVANTLCGGATGIAADVSAVAAATLRCEQGSCASVSGNSIGGSTGRFSVGVAVTGGGGVLAGNAIRPACASEAVLGIVLEGSSARLENNRVLPAVCPTNQAKLFRGLQLAVAATGGAPDVHSNVIDPGGASGECQSAGVDISRLEVDAAAAGIFRNNIVSAGTCGQRIAMVEQEGATVELLENNDLYAPPTTGTSIPAVLFRRGGTDASTAEQLNQLAGASGNLSADPKFVAYPNDLHLRSESPCIDRGTAAGAPVTDADGRVRPQGAGYDIGAYESVSP